MVHWLVRLARRMRRHRVRVAACEEAESGPSSSLACGCGASEALLHTSAQRHDHPRVKRVGDQTCSHPLIPQHPDPGPPSDARHPMATATLLDLPGPAAVALERLLSYRDLAQLRLTCRRGREFCNEHASGIMVSCNLCISDLIASPLLSQLPNIQSLMVIATRPSPNIEALLHALSSHNISLHSFCLDVADPASTSASALEVHGGPGGAAGGGAGGQGHGGCRYHTHHYHQSLNSLSSSSNNSSSSSNNNSGSSSSSSSGGALEGPASSAAEGPGAPAAAATTSIVAAFDEAVAAAAAAATGFLVLPQAVAATLEEASTLLAGGEPPDLLAALAGAAGAAAGGGASGQRKSHGRHDPHLSMQTLRACLTAPATQRLACLTLPLYTRGPKKRGVEGAEQARQHCDTLARLLPLSLTYLHITNAHHLVHYEAITTRLVNLATLQLDNCCCLTSHSLTTFSTLTHLTSLSLVINASVQRPASPPLDPSAPPDADPHHQHSAAGDGGAGGGDDEGLTFSSSPVLSYSLLDARALKALAKLPGLSELELSLFFRDDRQLSVLSRLTSLQHLILGPHVGVSVPTLRALGQLPKLAFLQVERLGGSPCSSPRLAQEPNQQQQQPLFPKLHSFGCSLGLEGLALPDDVQWLGQALCRVRSLALGRVSPIAALPTSALISRMASLQHLHLLDLSLVSCVQMHLLLEAVRSCCGTLTHLQLYNSTLLTDGDLLPLLLELKGLKHLRLVGMPSVTRGLLRQLGPGRLGRRVECVVEQHGSTSGDNFCSGMVLAE